MSPTPKSVIPRNPEFCLRCRRRYLYWVRGSESVIRCFDPCDNAVVVEAHDGFIGFRSTQGKGTTFTFMFNEGVPRSQASP